MIDQDRLETARAVLLKLLDREDSFAALVNSGVPFTTTTYKIASRAVSIADHLHERLHETQRPDTGHPAETALEQLLTLLTDHPDDKLPKWIAANAKHRKLAELNSYLGAEVE